MNNILSSQEELFQLEEDVTYLNCGYYSPQLKSVTTAAVEALGIKIRPNGITMDHIFGPPARLRNNFARLIQAPDPDRIAIAPSVSYGIANAARQIRPKRGSKIVVLEDQFPSNVYPWMRLCDEFGCELIQVSAPDSEQGRGKLWNQRLLEAIDDKTAVVAVPPLHWLDGTRIDLKAIREATRQHGAVMIVDGTQLIGGSPFDVSEIQPDALTCAGYKWLMGPLGIALAWYGEYFDEGIPIEENWCTRANSDDFETLVQYRPDLQPKGRRYSAGQHHSFVQVAMLNAGLEQVNAWGPENIHQYLKEITQPIWPDLAQVVGFIEEEAYRYPHLFGLHLPNPEKADRVREVFKDRNIFVTVRNGIVRVTPNVYNTQPQLAHFVESLKIALL